MQGRHAYALLAETKPKSPFYFNFVSSQLVDRLGWESDGTGIYCVCVAVTAVGRPVCAMQSRRRVENDRRSDDCCHQNAPNGVGVNVRRS
jgi:hypothetical protein